MKQYIYGIISGLKNENDRYEIELEDGRKRELTCGDSFEILNSDERYIKVAVEYDKDYYLVTKEGWRSMPLITTRVRIFDYPL